MNNKEIQNLIKIISDSNLSEFKLEDGDFKMTIRTNEYNKYVNRPVQASSPISMPSTTQLVTEQQQVQVTENPTIANTVETGEVDSGLLEIRSPIVGTFYRSPSPDKEAFVKVGDLVEPNTVVCIVEAMKLFNEIEAEVKGKIVDVLVEDSSPIEYDQVLYLVDPKG